MAYHYQGEQAPGESGLFAGDRCKMVLQSTGHFIGAGLCGVMKIAKSYEEGAAVKLRSSGTSQFKHLVRVAIYRQPIISVRLFIGVIGIIGIIWRLSSLGPNISQLGRN